MGWTRTLSTTVETVAIVDSGTLSKPFVLNFNAYDWEPSPYFDESFKPADKPGWLMELEKEQAEQAAWEQATPETAKPSPEQVVADAENTLHSIVQNRYDSSASRVRAAAILLERFDTKRELARLMDRINQLEQQNSNEATTMAAQKP